MKKLLFILPVFMYVVTFTSCVMTKQVAYFQNMDSVDLSGVKSMPEIRIKPNETQILILFASKNIIISKPHAN